MRHAEREPLFVRSPVLAQAFSLLIGNIKYIRPPIFLPAAKPSGLRTVRVVVVGGEQPDNPSLTCREPNPNMVTGPPICEVADAPAR